MRNKLEAVFAEINQNYANAYYPLLLADRSKTNVLYISPYNNGVGLYRAILPAMEMQKTTTHAAVITNVEEFSIEKQINGHEVGINEATIKWADCVVFQTSFHNLEDDIVKFREINKKSNLRFYMDVDDNYFYDHEGTNPDVADEMRMKLLNNMQVVDCVICENANLVELYESKLDQYNMKLPQFKIMPNYMSNECYRMEDDSLMYVPVPAEKTGKVKIGMVFNPTQFADVNPFKKILKEVKQRYKDKVELVVFGWNGKIYERKFAKDALAGVEFTHIKPVPVTQYFQTLAGLNLDFALMPLKENEFNECKSYHKLLQYSQIGIPVICSHVEPYINCIAPADMETDEENPQMIKANTVILNEDWMKHIANYISHRETLLPEMAGYNDMSVQTNYIWDQKRELFLNLF